MTFTDVLDELGIPYKTHGSSHHVTEGWCGLTCPYCNGHDHLGFPLTGRGGNCWTCGPTSPVRALSALSGKPSGAVAALLGRTDPGPARADPKPRGKLVTPFKLCDVENSQSHYDYLEKRRYDPVEIQRIWGVKCIRMDAKYPWRLFIPIIVRGETVSWTTRSINENIDSVRYRAASINQEVVSGKSVLYGEDYAQHAIIICEGPTDVWAIGPGAVATMGLSYTAAQVYRMAAYPMRYVCFDSEPAAQIRAHQLVNNLTPFPGSTFLVRTKSGKDPASSDKGEIHRLRKAVFGTVAAGL